jgi:hypothetical protein
MALFTTADRDAIKTALITAATEGFASVSIGGQTVQTYTLDQLRKILELVQAEIAADNTSGTGGMRFRKMVPGSTG